MSFIVLMSILGIQPYLLKYYICYMCKFNKDLYYKENCYKLYITFKKLLFKMIRNYKKQKE